VIDLHTHSRHSDGSSSPAELAALAREVGLGAIALTDHDTTSGLAEMAEACAENGVELVAGVEVSLKDLEFRRSRGGGEVAPISIHLLGYFVPVDPAHPFQARLAELRQDRAARNEQLIDALRGLGFTRITEDELARVAGGVDNIGRPHFARAMIDLHPEIVGEDSAETWQSVFTDWLGVGGRAYISKAHTPIEEFVADGREHGMVFSIAHPLVNYLSPGEDPAEVLPDVIDSLRERGVVGVEATYGGTPAPTRRVLEELTRRAGMIPTGGSDYHGTFKREVRLGRGYYGDLCVEDRILDELKDARG
jgi:predicted metal-dependent phosphoesterase TrpH